MDSKKLKITYIYSYKHILVHFFGIRSQEANVVFNVTPCVSDSWHNTDEPNACHQCPNSKRSVSHSNHSLSARTSDSWSILTDSQSRTNRG